MPRHGSRSFEDPETADFLNANFVAMKVDREERPDVDSVYMAATQAISGEGGWPMSVFLTPDGLAFMPEPISRPVPLPGGRPSATFLKPSMKPGWSVARGRAERRGLPARHGRRATCRGGAAGPNRRFLDASLLSGAVALLARSEDPDAGGFGNAPKFPPSAVLEFLVRHAAVP